MKRDYEKEAQVLLEKFRPLRTRYLKFVEGFLNNSETAVKSNTEIKEFISIGRQISDLDPLKIMFYGDSVPFRDTILPENKRKENRAEREKALIKKIVSALKSGKMKPLK